jgi:uncharacterized membrane protein
MKSKPPRTVRGTLVGGLALLLPFVFVAWLLQKVWDLVTKLAGPATAFLPERLAGSVLVSASATGILLLALVYAAGLLARTPVAQRLIEIVHDSVIGSLPQFSFLRGFTESMDDSDDDAVEVVLVPTAAGWTLGFVFEAGDAPVVGVFVPGAPKWASGSVVFAERAAIRPAGIDFAEAIRIQKHLGADSGDVVRALVRA